MSYVTLRYLYCDGDGCPLATEAYREGIGPKDTIAEQRRWAQADGWLVAQPGGKDYCAECRERIEKSQTSPPPLKQEGE